MRVVLLPAVAGRETGQIMTNSRKRHTPEQVVRTHRAQPARDLWPGTPVLTRRRKGSAVSLVDI